MGASASLLMATMTLESFIPVIQIVKCQINIDKILILTSQVLDSAGDADSDVELRGDDFSSLANLQIKKSLISITLQ